MDSKKLNHGSIPAAKQRRLRVIQKIFLGGLLLGLFGFLLVPLIASPFDIFSIILPVITLSAITIFCGIGFVISTTRIAKLKRNLHINPSKQELDHPRPTTKPHIEINSEYINGPYF